MKKNRKQPAEAPRSDPQGRTSAADGIPGRDELRRISAEIAREFPPTVETTAVVLMDVNPFLIHAYWNLAEGALHRALQAFGTHQGKPRLVLRFREIAGDSGAARARMAPRDAFDREVSETGGRLEVEVWSPGKTYEAELGLTAEDGGWLSLARSNRVQMPPAGPEDEARRTAAQTLADTPPDIPRPPPPAAGGEPPPGLEGGVAAPSPAAAAPDWRRPGEAEADREDGPAARVDRTLAGGEEPLEPVFPNVAPLAAEAQPQPEPERSVSLELPETPPPPVEPVGDAPVPERPEQPVELPGSLLRLSSPALAGGEPDLELHAELHVYGRTRPGWELRLFGRQVPLNEDGSFHIRQTIPNESLLLPLLMTEPKGTPEGD